MKWIACALLFGCGRIAFDPHDDAAALGDAADGAPFDVAPNAVANVAAGGPVTCVRLGSGDVWCWGRGDNGHLGAGAAPHSGVPRRIALPSPATTLECNDVGCCVTYVGISGRIACWGFNDVGQFGMTGMMLTPTMLAPLDIAEYSVGNQVMCYRRNNGTVACAGGAGLLGDGSMTNRASYGDVTGVTDAIGLSCGDRHTCALRANGSVTCWGLNAAGQLGDGSAALMSAVPTVGPAGPYSALATGDNFTCGLRTGAVECWGEGDLGELGDGMLGDRNTSVTVATAPDAIQIVAGSNTGCLRRSDDTVACWGGGAMGERGDGTTTPMVSTPVTTLVTDVIALSSRTGGHSCALTSARTVYCWGYNNYGQLGQGNVGGNSSTPVAVQGLPAL